MSLVPYVVYDTATKLVLRSGVCDEADFAAQQREPTERVAQLECKNWGKRWRVVNDALEELTAPAGVVSMAIRRERMMAMLVVRRKKVDAAEIKVGTMVLPGDADTKAFFSAAARRAATNPDQIVTFRVKIGESYGYAVLLASQIINIDNAFFDRSCRCHEKESTLAARINSSNDPESLAAAINTFTDEVIAVPVDPPPSWVL